MDGERPRLTRCFRGHSTPAGKTFCDTCGAPLEDAVAAGPPLAPPLPAVPAVPEDDLVAAPSAGRTGWRGRLRRSG